MCGAAIGVRAASAALGCHPPVNDSLGHDASASLTTLPGALLEAETINCTPDHLAPGGPPALAGRRLRIFCTVRMS